jgi:quinolinate synthase
MKKITIDKVYNSLVNNVYKVRVPKATADKARYAIERMLSIG